MIPKMTFEKHLCLFLEQLFKDLVSKGCPGECSGSLLERCFRGFVMPVLEYCSAVRCLANDTHLKLLDRAVSGALFLTGRMFESDIAHCRSVAVLYMLYKIRCNPMHPLNDAPPGPYVLVWVTRGALVTYRYTYMPPSSTAEHLFPSQCPSGTILLTPYSMVWDWRLSKAGQIVF